MNDATDSKGVFDDAAAGWMKAATDFWGAMMKMAVPKPARKPSSPFGEDRFSATVESQLKLWQTAMMTMTEPGAVETAVKGFQMAPDMSFRFFMTTTQGVMELQKRWADRLNKIGAPTEAFSFSDVDKEFINRWTDVYTNEFRKFLHIPQLGLTRQYQEKMNDAADKFNLFQAAVAEFLHVLSIPMEKSFRVMQEQVAQQAEKGELPEDPKSYYNMWIKILEGHYMTLFQSKEYLATLAKAIGALNQFISARQSVLEDVVKFFPVSTQKETDELYREMYLLKKRIRKLEKTIEAGSGE
jgi:class III poly(R)-hydroxyalkanoic acid synthase PhaE subunit